MLTEVCSVSKAPEFTLSISATKKSRLGHQPVPHRHFYLDCPKNRRNPLFRYASEKTPAQFAKESKKRFAIHGAEHLERAFARGRGAILIMSHLGHCEFLAFVPHLLKYPCTVIGKSIRNPYINTWVQSLRRIVSVETSAKPERHGPCLPRSRKIN